MTELEKRASRMKWSPPPPGSEERKEMPANAFLSPSTRTFPYKVKIDGQWVVSKKGLRSAISVANFRGNSMISSRASKLLEELLSNEVKHLENVDNIISHFGVPGMKWGVRKQERAAARSERRDIKWVKGKGEKVTAKTRKAVSKEMSPYAQALRASRLKSGKISKTAMNQYNQKLAEVMNEKVGNVAAPSGRVIRYVAKRGDIGVHTALADQGYNMGQVRQGVNAAGRIAYKKEVLKKG